MKLASAIVIAATIGGTCSVGGERKIPPSEAELAARKAGPAAEPLAKRDWPGLPEECREFAAECPECDEVESMRRQIELKKCVPVCGAYLDQLSVVETVPAAGIELLTSEAMCGKKSPTCSVVEDSACEHALRYASASQAFRQNWTTGGAELQGEPLLTAVRTQFVGPHLDLHDAVITWAVANEYDPAALVRAGGRLAKIIGGEELDAARSAVADTDDRRALAVETLFGLALSPGDPATFKERRSAAEAPLQQ